MLGPSPGIKGLIARSARNEVVNQPGPCAKGRASVGRVLMLADGGECISDLGTMHDWQGRSQQVGDLEWKLICTASVDPSNVR